MKTTRKRETRSKQNKHQKDKAKRRKNGTKPENNNCFKRDWQRQENAKMPMFRCFGAFVVFIVSGLLEYCGTINREKRTREKGEEHLTQEII